MATDNQIKQIEYALREYRKKYLTKKYTELDESATRIMVNALLSKVLGYKELEDIKTEYEIRGTYADYVIQIARKKWFVVEVKAISVNLNEHHIRQSLGYAANEGIDWVILTNGRQLHLFHVVFSKPISTTKVLELDLGNLKTIKVNAKQLAYLSKRCVLKKELDNFWKRSSALAPESISKMLYSIEIGKLLRRKLKKDTGINFNLDDILEGLHTALVEDENTKLRIKE